MSYGGKQPQQQQGPPSQAYDANAYANSLYLDVIGDTASWAQKNDSGSKTGHQQSKLSIALEKSKGVGLDRNLPLYDIAVIGAQVRKEGFFAGSNFGPKHNYIEYVVKVTRVKDGATCTVCRRYKVLRSFYEELLEQGIIDKERDAELNLPDFPTKKMISEETFLFERADTESTLVKLRKEELNNFFRKLFNRKPDLWKENLTHQFFNMESMDVGRSYAESRFDPSGTGQQKGEGEGVGFDSSLGTFNPSDPAQWNPYTMAMQASEATRAQNYPQQTEAWREGRTAAAGAGGGGGRGRGARQQQQRQPIGGAPSGGAPNAGLVRSLCEMGFEEGQATQALVASGGDANLAAEYCMNGKIPQQQQQQQQQEQQPRRIGGGPGPPPYVATPPQPPQPRQPHRGVFGGGTMAGASSLSSAGTGSTTGYPAGGGDPGRWGGSEGGAGNGGSRSSGSGVYSGGRSPYPKPGSGGSGTVDV